MLGDDLDDRRARERYASGQEVIECRPQSVDVHAAIGVPGPPGLLRGHVVRGAHGRPRFRPKRRIEVDQFLGESEIQQFRLAIPSEKDVRGFDIPVDEPVLMCVEERAGDLGRHLHRFPPGQRPPPLEPAV